MTRPQLNSLILFIVFVFVVLVRIIESRACIDNRCTCSNEEENTTAVCRMNDLENLTHSFNNPAKVKSLNLSSNRIGAIKRNTFANFSGLLTLEMSQNQLKELLPDSFEGLNSLLKLSLAHNNIQVIHKDTFRGLYSLQLLNLSGNNIQTWTSHGLSMNLPSLITIDVQGNMGWRPSDKYLLELPRLMEVRNVSWAAECMECWLIKNVSERLIKIYNNTRYNITNPVTCITKRYTLSDFLTLLARNHFLVRECVNLTDCIMVKETNHTEFHSCWYVNQRVMYGQVLLGIIGGCLNLVVVLNILLTKSLRKNVSLVLVSNLALGDTLTCVYSVIIACIIVSYHYLDLRDHSGSICPKVGFFWLLGQCTASVTSVALTVERYLCIVYSMKPDIRMTPRLASLTITFNWLLAVSIMTVAHYFKMFRKTYLCLPISYEHDFPIETRFTLGLGSAGITLYLTTIPMYAHIFVVVKRSSQQMGVKRESTLAKRIAMLVGSNLVFFFIPVLSLGMWMIFTSSRNDLLSIYSRDAIQDWIPLYCLIINSCLNPLVHAFRNDKFKTELKRNLSSLTGKTNHMTVAGSGNHVTLTNNTNQVTKTGGTNHVTSNTQ